MRMNRKQSSGKNAVDQLLSFIKIEKKIYDSVHRFIRLSSLEWQLINTRPFQRLHYIHQLGVTFLVYPGAVHRRFEHSLGAMELATRIYDEVTNRSPSSLGPQMVGKKFVDLAPDLESLELFLLALYSSLCRFVS